MKAIMIVDIPDNCNKSLLSKTPASITFNHGTYKTLLYVEGYLKPMPQELPTPYMMRQIQIAEGIQTEIPPYTEDYQKGYNDCLGEILEETNDRDI